MYNLISKTRHIAFIRHQLSCRIGFEAKLKRSDKPSNKSLRMNRVSTNTTKKRRKKLQRSNQKSLILLDKYKDKTFRK